MGTDGIVVEWLRWVLLIVSGSLDRPGGMRFPRGALSHLRPPRRAATAPPGPPAVPSCPRVANQIPAVALADEIEAGNVRVLVVTGGNPIGALPEPDRVRAALRRLDALVVVDVIENELSELATHVLPATGRARAHRHLDVLPPLRPLGDAVDAPVVVPARPPGARCGGCSVSVAARPASTCSAAPILTRSTDELYLRAIIERSPLDADAVFAAGPRGFDLAGRARLGRTRSMLPDGRWRLARPDARAPRRPPRTAGRAAPHPGAKMAWSNSVRYGADDRPTAPVASRRRDAAGVVDGGRPRSPLRTVRSTWWSSPTRGTGERGLPGARPARRVAGCARSAPAYRPVHDHAARLGSTRDHRAHVTAFFHRFGQLSALVYRHWGRLGRRFAWIPCLVLVSTGRNWGSGGSRCSCTPTTVTTGSWWRRTAAPTRTPGWLYNVHADPSVEVHVGNERYPGDPRASSTPPTPTAPGSGNW